jgi:acetyltransferase EpsM
MERRKLLILGTHEFAEEVVDIVVEGGDYEVTGFVENLDRTRCELTIAGLPVYWIDDINAMAETHAAVCAIGTTKRFRYTAEVEQLGFQFVTVKHPSAQIFPSAQVGPGCIINAGVIAAAHVVLGSHVILNRGVMIGHHTQLGSHVTVNPGVNIAGRVEIGDQTYIGMSATILNDLRIGRETTIGAGSVVTRDVPANVLVLGYPASIAKQNTEAT